MDDAAEDLRHELSRRRLPRNAGALGGGHALLKWITSFPRNPLQGLPTVSGVVLVSDAETGQLRAVLDAGSVTALRTGAAAVLGAETLARADAASATVIGAGVNGRAAARTFVTRGRAVRVWDVNGARAEQVARELGCGVASSLDGGARGRHRRHRHTGSRGAVRGRLRSAPGSTCR